MGREQNAQIGRRALEAAIRKPKPDFETVNALYHPDHELVTPLSRLEGTTYPGAAGFRAWLASTGADWESLTWRLERVVELDDERVLVAAAFIGQGRRGGVPIEQVQGLVMTVRDGRVARTEAYSSVEEALAAVGASEWEPMNGETLPMNLDEATRVEGDDGRYSARLSDAWEIWGPNGGYLAAIALRAAGRRARIPRPASFYCHFLSSPAFEKVELTVELIKSGRRSESLAVRMTQHETQVLYALVRTAADAPGYQHQEGVAPEIPPPEACPLYDRTKAGQPSFNFWNNVTRRRPESDTTAGPAAPIAREWVRFEPTSCFDDLFIDAARPLILLDTFGWPAAYRKYQSWDYLAPNLDTSVWFHQFTPYSEWLLIDHECPIATDGLLGVSGRVWDTNRHLLATGSAQLCCIPTTER